jgi:4-nitrophenyl phosphatase
MHRLGSIRALLIDMDGVLYRGDAPVAGLDAFFQFLCDRQIRFQLVTNNSTLTPGLYVDKMARMGVQVQESDVLTSSLATADYLAARFPRGAQLYAIGEEGLLDALQQAGFRLGTRDPQAVVVGFDRDLTYAKLRTACLLIRAGRPYIATNPDVTLPVPEGQVPGTGAILAALSASAEQEPTMIGKPEPVLMEQAMRRLGSTPGTTAALGDRPETDILSARRAGLLSILALSGATDRERLAALRATLGDECAPDLIVEDIRALVREWTRVLDT